MKTQMSAGEQLSSQVLYERQKKLRAEGRVRPGPAIVAAGLATPENMGMVLRVADAGGAARVVFVNRETPRLTQIRKTARNADAQVRWEVVTPDGFVETLIRELPPLIAVELTTDSTSLFETTLPEQCALVVGSERHGIPEEILHRCAQAVHIPLFGVNGSMNVTHALAIALFEWRRQYREI